jgi:hypothetical protein
MIYENDQPLGPMHSTDFDVITQGAGRAVHWRKDDSPALYGASSVFIFSTSDNSDPNANGRAYWAVKPNVDAVTCPDIKEKYAPPPFYALETPPRAVVLLRHFEVSPDNHMILSRDIEAFSHLGDTPDEDRSPALLYEDDRLLGPARSTEIGTKGLGGYRHLQSHGMTFSTSDNSDPRTNGRSYYVVFP